MDPTVSDDLEDLMEDGSTDVELDFVPPTRLYQVSNIIIQDQSKDGLLSFLSENTRYGSPTSTSENTRYGSPTSTEDATSGGGY